MEDKKRGGTLKIKRNREKYHRPREKRESKMIPQEKDSANSEESLFLERMRATWAREAEFWRKWYPLAKRRTREATELLIKTAGIKEGAPVTILDLASGAGDPALSIARLVAPRGRVVATDLVPEMLRFAAENAMNEGIVNISFQEAAADSLPFPENYFDFATSRFGVMFFPNPVRALEEIKRVLKPGGRSALMSWGPKENNEYWRATIGVIIKKGIKLPSQHTGAPDPYRFSKAGDLWKLLENAGYSRVEEEDRVVNLVWEGTLEEAWENFLDTWRPMGAFDSIPEKKMHEIKEDCIRELSKFRNSDGAIVTKAPIIIGRGEKLPP